jgi:hypothetical protein
MSDAYAYARTRTAAVLALWNAGTIVLKRVTTAAPEDATPWVPGSPTTVEYALDARVDGMVEGDMTDSRISMSDLKVIVSPKARLSGAVVDIVPVITDLLVVDGVDKVIKKIEAVPASGDAARYHLFVAA